MSFQPPLADEAGLDEPGEVGWAGDPPADVLSPGEPRCAPQGHVHRASGPAGPKASAVEPGDEGVPLWPLLGSRRDDPDLRKFLVQRDRRKLKNLRRLDKVQSCRRLLDSRWGLKGSNVQHADSVHGLLLGQLCRDPSDSQLTLGQHGVPHHHHKQAGANNENGE